MCIIVAKNAGVKMPTKEILSNCFTNNPDGAGIMLAAKNQVVGVKGLMTFDAFTAALKKLEKRFGSLNKLPVVMHFRIKTHGAAIAANTHPFPVAASYKPMRRLEWTSTLGMAHNGIIQAVGHHEDIKKENVSDTMVFIRRIVQPIAAKIDIMQDDKVLDALEMAADSKLAFLNAQGVLKLRGRFEMKDGVYYSNSTYEAARYKSWRIYGYDWDDYGIQSVTTTKKGGKKENDWPALSPDDEKYLMEELALDYGLDILGEGCTIVCEDFEFTPCHVKYAVLDETGELYYWDDENYEWFPSSYSDKWVDIRFKEAEVDA